MMCVSFQKGHGVKETKQKVTIVKMAETLPRVSLVEGGMGYYYTTTVCLYIITKTCLYNFDPLKPHFYRVKLGFTVEGVLTSTHNLCF